MIQITATGIIRSRISCSFIGTAITGGFTFGKTLIVGAYMLLCELELTVVSEIIGEEVAPAAFVSAVVDHDIC
jgi:hypothetical protein